MHSELRENWYAAIEAFATARGLSVNYPNIEFDDRELTQYLAVAILPSQPELFTVCGSARYLWTLQVSVYVRDDTGEFAAMAIGDALAEAFPVHHRFVGATKTFEVQTPPSPAVPIALEGWFAVPVSFQIQTLH